MGMDLGDISTNHNHATIPTMTGTAAVPEDTHCTPHPATRVACAALQLMDAPITTHVMMHPTHLVTPHPELTISATNITHATIPLIIASLIPAIFTALQGITANEEGQAIPKTFNPP